MNRETVDRYDSLDASNETPRHWEVNYLLPQLLPGTEYPSYDVNAALMRVLKRLFAALRAPRVAPPATSSFTTCRSHRHVYH
jgi:hypothetical protein